MRRKKILVVIVAIVILFLGIEEYKVYSNIELADYTTVDNSYEEYSRYLDDNSLYSLSFKEYKNVITEVKIQYLCKTGVTLGNHKICVEFPSDFVVKDYINEIYSVSFPKDRLIEVNDAPAESEYGKIGWYCKSNLMGTNVNKIEVILENYQSISKDIGELEKEIIIEK